MGVRIFKLARAEGFWRRGTKKNGLRRFGNVFVFGNLRDTDDAHPSTGDLKALADGVSAIPKLSDHGLIDDGDGRSGLVVGKW